MGNISARILLLDDEAPSREYSRRAISRYVDEASIFTAATVEEAMDMLKAEPIDLAFLDVELTSSDGFTFCQYIHREYPNVKVVILTGHVDYGAKSYDYEPFDFLVKPVDTMRLEKTFSRFARAHKKTAKKDSGFVIETSTGFAMLNADEIVFVAKNGNTCEVHCEKGQVYRVAYTLDKLEGMLGGDFYRTHQSYLVPVSRIKQVNSTRFGTSYEAALDDGSIVPVSRNKYPKLKEFMMKRSTKL